MHCIFIRHRLQYHDALILDLQEQGYPSSADYLVQLIEYQDHLRTEHGPDTKVWNRPQLIKCKEELDRLFCSLRKAEKAHYEGTTFLSIKVYIKIKA